jgi:hypothetical protein
VDPALTMTAADRPRRESIQVDRDAVVTMQHVTFSLQQHQFLRLTKIPSFVGIWAHSFFAGTGVFMVTIIARLIDARYFNGASAVSSLEWVTLGILGLLVLIFEGINFYIPSERKKMVRTIQSYFDKHENQ